MQAITAFALIVVAAAWGSGHNVLTPEERRDGYELLWNGKDYQGWTLEKFQPSTPADPESTSAWAITTTEGKENGGHRSIDPDSNVLEIVAAGPYLMTRDTSYQNFDWKAEWKLPAATQGRSALIYFFKLPRTWPGHDMFFPIMNWHWEEWKDVLRNSGSLYDLLPIQPSLLRPDHSPAWMDSASTWNNSRIISFGMRAAHYGNGRRLMEYELGSPAFDRAASISKYYTRTKFAALHAGSFELQDHGQKWIMFRNLRVKRLEPRENPWAEGSPYRRKGADTSLVDALAFTQDLFPRSATGIGPHTIVPRTAVDIKNNRDGVYILFSERGNYSLRIEDLRGARVEVRELTAAVDCFLPGAASGARVLTIWKDGKKIHGGIIPAVISP